MSVRFGYIVCIVSALCVISPGCRRANDVRDKSAAGMQSNTARGIHYTADDLNRLVRPGMPGNLVVRVLGEPDLETQGKNGIRTLDYINAPTTIAELRDSGVAGFQVILSNDVLVKWSPIYASVGPHTVSPKPSPADPPIPAQIAAFDATNLTSIGFHVVNNESVEGSQYVDTALFPKLGYINVESALTVRHLLSLDEGKQVRMVDGKEVETPTLVLGLTREDSKAMLKLTTDAVGKRILVTVNDEPVLAPFVISPIETASFVLSMPDTNTLNRIKSELLKLVMPRR